jgi:hypothetical protein
MAQAMRTRLPWFEVENPHSNPVYDMYSIPDNPEPAGTNVSHAEIARRAYLLWEQRGRPEGRDVEFWLEAEADLIADQLLRDALQGLDREESDDDATPTQDSDAFTPDSGPEIAAGHGRLPARHEVPDG